MSKKTILVVDDLSAIRAVLGDFLSSIGYDVITSDSGTCAISELDRADLLITDFNMPPGMNGAELTEKAKHEKPGLPVIIMTGNPQDIPVGHKADRVIEKPVNFSNFQRIIAELLYLQW